MFSIINMGLSNDLFWRAHVSGQHHTLKAALNAAMQLFKQGDLHRDQTCIPVYSAGVAAVVFSVDGERSFQSEAMRAGFRFIDSYRLTDAGDLLQMGYEFDENKSEYVGEKPQYWSGVNDPELIEHVLASLKPSTRWGI